jgi:stage V sporulation protein D (sporulation-specific penicillin-binding protein)
MRANATLRIRIITAGVLFLALILIARLYHIQIAYGSAYREQAERQYVHTVRDFFDRGSIFLTTRSGERVSAATVKSGFLMAINPQRIEDPEAVYAQLAPLVPLEREDFLRRAQMKATYVEVAEGLDEETTDAVDALDIDGVSLHRDQWRYYPGEELAAATIGFVASDGTTLAGRYGLERSYEGVLEREAERLSVNFFAELFEDLGGVVLGNDSERPGHLETWIEPTVARALESELREVQEEYGSVLSGGIVLDPRTGAIHALGVTPSFNLNDRSGVALAQFRNPLVENVYEMGSIIKPLTMAAGIDSGAIVPEDTYYDAGTLELDGYTIGNFDGRGRGMVPMQEVLNQSLNTGVAWIVSQMGTERFAEYFRALGLGSETGIDLPNETHGLISNLNSPRKIEYATASFGQGIAMTPIETVRALASLANGGVLTTPHVGRRIVYEDGGEREVSFPEDGRVFSEETAETVTRMLVEVVDSSLAYGQRSLEHHTIAAKTGTAQIANPEAGGYYDDRYLHSFFGYFPAYEPRFLVFLYTVEPQGVRYASETLTDPFMDLATFLINYYDLPPDR